MGLIQFGPTEKFQDKDQVIFFLNLAIILHVICPVKHAKLGGCNYLK